MINRARVKRISQRRSLVRSLSVALVVGVGILIASSAGFNPRSTALTIGQVPIPILLKFIADQPARTAYFRQDKQGLHDRLVVLGIEEDMKAFYRPQIQDEVKLDQHIHQIFYERTGYIGEAYRVNAQGTLVLKQLSANTVNEWLQLAQETGLIVGTRQENGILYVISPAGTTAPYADIAAIFPLAELRELAKRKR